MSQDFKKIRILRDNREQTPWKFENYPNVIVEPETLWVGDYTLVGHDMPNDDYSIIIERKADCRELAKNLGSDWKRFEREMKRAKGYNTKLILVCSPNNFYELYRDKLTMMHPNFIRKQLMILKLKYNVHCMFFNTPADAEQYCVFLFNSILKLMDEDE